METLLFAVLKSQLLIAPFVVFAIWFAVRKLSLKFQWRLHKGIIIALLVLPVLFLLPIGMEQRIQRSAQELVTKNNIPIPFFSQPEQTNAVFDGSDYKTDDESTSPRTPSITNDNRKIEIPQDKNPPLFDFGAFLSAVVSMISKVADIPGIFFLLLSGAGLFRFLILWIIQLYHLAGVTRHGVERIQQKGIEIIYSQVINSPFSAGLIKKRVFLPVSYKNNSEFIIPIMEHELTHIKRGHIYWTFIEKLLTSIFWYNPLLHLLHQNGELLREYQCDSEVAAKVSPVKYGKALLNCIEEKLSGTQTYHLSTGWRTENSMKQRLYKLFDNKNKKSKFTGVLLGIALAVTTVLLLGIASCATGGQNGAAMADQADKEIILTVDEMLLSSPNSDLVIAEFERRNPGITIQISRDLAKGNMITKEMDEPNKYKSQFVSKHHTDLEAGTAPDILWVDKNIIDDAHREDYLVNLETLMTADPGFDKKDYFEPIVDALKYKNNLYAVPISIGFYTPLLVTGEDTLKEAGLPQLEGAVDWDELINAQETYRQNNDVGEDFKLTLVDKKDVQFTILSEIMGRFIDLQNSKLTINSPDFVSYLEGLKSRYSKEEFVFQNAAQTYDVVEKKIAEKKSLFVAIPGFYNGYTQFARAYKHFEGETPRVILPSFSEHITFYPNELLSISSSCKNKDAAWKFVKFLLNEGPLLDSNYGFSVNRKTFAVTQEERVRHIRENKQTYGDIYGFEPTQELLEKEKLIMAEMMERAVYYFPFWQVRNIVRPYIDNTLAAYFNGSITAGEAAANIQSKLEKALEDIL